MADPNLTAEWARHFWARVDKSGGPDACWPWTKGKSPRGYGLCTLPPRKPARANRIAYLLTHGKLPVPFCLHSCDNPPCCNPSHLREGTHADNMADREARGRQTRGAQSWPSLHPERMPRGDRNGTRTRPETRPRGESCNFAKRTEEDVIRMRKMASGGMTTREIADAIGVSWYTVYDIVKRYSWKHLP